MISKGPVDVIFGAVPVGDTAFLHGVMHFGQKQDVARILDTLCERGYHQIDTARNYAMSEALLGEAGAANRSTIHTKIRGIGNGDLEAAKVNASIEESLRDLKTNQVETVFLHAVDRRTPFAESAKAVSDAIAQGKFKRFGICNYTPAEIQQYLDICEEHGYTKPSIYQWHYNALVRGSEKELLPLLRKHNMAFFAFSPAAGGFFSRDASDSARWSNDNFFGKLYNMICSHPGAQASVPTVQEAAKNP